MVGNKKKTKHGLVALWDVSLGYLNILRLFYFGAHFIIHQGADRKKCGEDSARIMKIEINNCSDCVFLTGPN